LTGRVLELRGDILNEDRLATSITEKWLEWDMMREIWKQEKLEVRNYIYATDTTRTTNAQLPWKNKTTVPKLCQIRDNLYANYTATMFPTQKKWLIWEANEQDPDSVAKRDAITNYMSWVISQNSFKHEMDKIILDYIDYGNCFATVEWADERVELPDKTQVGYVGPAIRRINPLNIVFNPIAENFQVSPKIIRSLISMGELKEMLQRMSNDENRAEYETLWEYLRNLRGIADRFEGDWKELDNLYIMDGFTSYRNYLKSGMVEVLTFYGDLYNQDDDVFYKNHVITVVDRHKLIGNKPNPSYFGYPPIFHVAWRKKPDNLWGMGPLDNLVGMQYRMDHIENMAADIWDFTAFPVKKIKGMVEEFTWEPGADIYVSEEGDVEIVAPDVNIMNADMKIERLAGTMEEMAGAPKEAMGFRSPGEKTKYEVQVMQNAASRLFASKIKQFEEQEEEPLFNAMLELAKRQMVGTQVIPVFDNEFNTVSFQNLSVEDITGIGRIKPVASRHFAEQADLIQNMTNLTNSPLWATVQPHFSGKTLAKIIENIFNLEQYQVVIPFVGIAEQAEGQKFANALQQQVAAASQTASGIGFDHDMSVAPGGVAGATQPGPNSQIGAGQ
jgi:hypothetical protein